MSVRFESANSENASVATFYSSDTACAWGFWVYFVSLPSSGNAGIVTMEGSGFRGIELQVTSGGNLRLYSQNTGGGTTGTASISTATWYYIWARRDGTGFGGNWNVYVDGSTTADITRNDSWGGGTLTLAEGVIDSSAFTDVRLLNFKAWSADLAASNANTEKADCDHQSTTNAYSEYLLDDHTTDLADEGPGTRDLTASGTLSTEANTGDWSCGAGPATAIKDMIGGTGIIPFAR